MELNDLKRSEKELGQLLPVFKNSKGEIIDGFHRKRVNPDWKEVILPVKGEIETLRMRVHLNILRREVPHIEKEEWVKECREILKKRGLKGTQEEIAKELKMTQRWVSEYDLSPTQPHNLEHRSKFYGYNVWGFKTEKWRELITEADPSQPDVDFYHGATPAFVIHQLIQMFDPKSVLDSMAGTGTTGYVCKQYGIPCDQFDLYSYPKFGVKEGDAEFVGNGKTYDMIFNHIPYLGMVKYGDSIKDLSRMKEERFFDKLERVFKHNHKLLKPNGIYAVLVGDWRSGGRVVHITAQTTATGLNNGFVLQDEAIKLTGEMKGKTLQEYRAAKFSYLAQTFDTVLMFKKATEARR